MVKNIFLVSCMALIEKIWRCHLFWYCPEILGTEVWGRGARLQVVLSGQSSQPQKLTVAVKGITAKTQHQGGKRGAFGFGINWDSEKQRVRRDFLQLVGRHV